MKRLSGSEIAGRLQGIVHADTQVHPDGVDLTVSEVHRLTGGGSLDFGGSEYEQASRRKIEPRLAAPDDDYGWWHLDSGPYLVVYNESFEPEEDERARLEPLGRLLRAGASHAGRSLSGAGEELASLLFVSPSGCDLKENCRISRLTAISGG